MLRHCLLLSFVLSSGYLLVSTPNHTGMAFIRCRRRVVQRLDADDRLRHPAVRQRAAHRVSGFGDDVLPEAAFEHAAAGKSDTVEVGGGAHSVSPIARRQARIAPAVTIQLCSSAYSPG